MSNVQFLKNFILHPNRTGAIAPSTQGLAELITDSADLSNARVVVELGPGTGVFTEQILQKIPKDGTFLAIEANADFAQTTRARCPAAVVQHDSAVNLKSLLEQTGFSHCDRIVSGLPWASFPDELQDKLLAAIDESLASGGRFLTFAYVFGIFLPAGRKFKKKLERVFRHVQMTRVVWLNLPPAFVYVAQK